MKYSLNLKKERVNKIINAKQSEINSINDTIKTLKRYEKKFNDEYYIKYNKYLKIIERQIEEEKKEKIRMILEELNKYFDEEPEDFRFDRFKKLNEKFQYLLNEESNVIHEKKDGENLIDSEFKAQKRYLYV